MGFEVDVPDPQPDRGADPDPVEIEEGCGLQGGAGLPGGEEPLQVSGGLQRRAPRTRTLIVMIRVSQFTLGGFEHAYPVQWTCLMGIRRIESKWTGRRSRPIESLCGQSHVDHIPSLANIPAMDYRFGQNFSGLGCRDTFGVNVFHANLDTVRRHSAF